MPERYQQRLTGLRVMPSTSDVIDGWWSLFKRNAKSQYVIISMAHPRSTIEYVLTTENQFSRFRKRAKYFDRSLVRYCV